MALENRTIYHRTIKPLERNQRRFGFLWPAQQAALDAARARRRDIQSRMRRLEKAANDAAIADLSAKIAAIAIGNPSLFHKSLRRALGPVRGANSTDKTIPTAAGQLNAEERFLQFFSTMYTNLAATTPAQDDPARWLPSIPRTLPGGDTMLRAVVSWQEVYVILFPPHKAVRRPLCVPGCALCTAYNAALAAWKWGDERASPPAHRPRLWTSRARGPDGLAAELLRWTRPHRLPPGTPPPPDYVSPYAHRRAIATALAALFNRLLDEEAVPDCATFKQGTLYPVHKSGPRDDPNNYRGIVVGGLLGKIFGLVLASRLAHWSQHNNILSPMQSGFKAYQGADEQALVLTELIRQRARHGHNTYVLFADFKKAFDSIHVPTLIWMLGIMGMPPNITSLLQNWMSTSTIQVSVNGTLSAPFVQTRGTPQGGALSPILFNLYIEVLLRHLHTYAADTLGVVAPPTDPPTAGPPPADTVPYAAHGYADDLSLLSPTYHALQLLLNELAAWAAAFGLQIGVGNGKTEAIMFDAAHARAPGTPAPPHPQPLTLPGSDANVQFVNDYRYLGIWISRTLLDTTVAESLESKLAAAAHALFPHHRVVRRFPVALQVQLLQSLAAGAIGYYLPFVTPAVLAPICAKLDTIIVECGRAILRLSHGDPTTLVLSELGIINFASRAKQHRWRIMATTATHPLRSAPAHARPRLVQLLPTLLNEAPPLPGTPPHLANWATTAVASTASVPQLLREMPERHWHVSPRAHAIGRYLAQQSWQHKVAGGILPAAQADRARRPFVGGVSPNPAELTRLLEAQHGWAAPPVGVIPHLTPLSARGPAGAGTILVNCYLPAPLLATVARAGLGYSPLYRWPFYDAAALGDAPAYQQRAGMRCPVCAARSLEVPLPGIWHVLFECDHPALVAAAGAVYTSMWRLLRQLMDSLLIQLDAYDTEAAPLDWLPAGSQVGEVQHLVARALERLEQVEAQGRAALYLPRANVVVPGAARSPAALCWLTLHLLTCRPYSAQAVTPPGGAAADDTIMQLILAVGAVFDAVILPRHRLRAPSELWARWAATQIAGVAAVWRAIMAGTWRPPPALARQVARAPGRLPHSVGSPLPYATRAATGAAGQPARGRGRGGHHARGRGRGRGGRRGRGH